MVSDILSSTYARLRVRSRIAGRKIESIALGSYFTVVELDNRERWSMHELLRLRTAGTLRAKQTNHGHGSAVPFCRDSFLMNPEL